MTVVLIYHRVRSTISYVMGYLLARAAGEIAQHEAVLIESTKRISSIVTYSSTCYILLPAVRPLSLASYDRDRKVLTMEHVTGTLSLVVPDRSFCQLISVFSSLAYNLLLLCTTYE